MDNMFKLTFQTDSFFGEFQVDYSCEGSGVSSVKARIIKKGRTTVRIYGDELKMLKIVSPAKIKKSKIEIDGQKRQLWIPKEKSGLTACL